MDRRKACVLSAVVTWALSLTLPPAAAKINPNFTPNDLVTKSEQILVLKLKPADAKGLVHSTVQRALKGPKPKQGPVIDLTITAHEEQAKAVKKAVARSANDAALLFVGEDEHEQEAAFLHLSGRWILLDEGEKKGYWDMNQISAHMEGTWAGSSDMLLKIVRLLIKHPDTIVPVDSGCQWGDKEKIGKLGGAVVDVQAVDLAGDGKLFLYVAAAEGDRLYGFNRKAGKFEDVTGARKLAARSRAAAWGDFNADGRLDLASWDGTAVTLRLQGKGGVFGAPGKAVGSTKDCVGLTALDVGVPGKAGLLVSGSGAPVLLIPGAGGAFTVRPLKADPALAKGSGGFGRCLVADFDGDGLADVLQPGSRAGLMYKGKGGGSFATGARSRVALGRGRSGSFVGDWDHDGLLDVFAAAQDTCRLWNNKGGFVFHNMLGLSGEIAYISKPGGFGGGVCDVNNDGHQDILITYPGTLPQIFFNRAFRSFGHAHKLALGALGEAPPDGEPVNQEPELAPDEEDMTGEQAGLVRDLNGDGAEDLVVVFRHHKRKKAKGGAKPGPWETGAHHGEIWFFPRQVDQDAAFAARVALPPGKGFAGPLTVTGWAKKQCLGAWNVVPGTTEAFFGRPEAGPVEVRWRLPGGKRQRRIVVLEDGPARLVIGDEK